MKDRTILKPEDFDKIRGTIEAHQYRFDSTRNLWIKNIRLIKGVAKLRSSAPKYALATQVGCFIMYLSQDTQLTHSIKEAKYFYEGFDDPVLKASQWGAKLNLKFYSKKYYETVQSSMP